MEAKGTRSLLFSSLVLLLFFRETICGKYEKKLLRHLMVDYDDMERPVEDENEPLRLVFGVTLQQIIDVVIQFIYNFFLFILTI